MPHWRACSKRSALRWRCVDLKAEAAFGFVNALKPPGITSTSFGGWVKRIYGGAPVGHWGTLDPAASGVLVLAIGHATRLLPLVTPSDKRYAFELRLGTSTDTADATGQILETAAVPDDWTQRLPAIAAQLTGPLEQIPPMFSAVKVAGRPLYVSARRGQQIARAARPTRVLSLRVVATTQRSARMVIECEAGLYVRSLCEEIGTRLGTLAHMGGLVRTAAGPFSIDTASLPTDIAERPQACLLDPRSVLALRTVELDAPRALRFMNGNAVAQESDPAAERDAQTTVLVLHGNRCIGVGSLAVGGELSPRRVFD